ncbi:MAG: flagellar export chaperone FlgN, partial [Bdellovibrionota bacterium]
EASVAKQALVEAIRQSDTERMGLVGELALAWKTPVRDLTLPNLVIAIQGDDPKGAEQLRSAYNALTILIQRITEQNQDNAEMIQKSLEHLSVMKKNVLGEAVPKSNTYTQKGQRADGQQGGARLISKEA